MRLTRLGTFWSLLVLIIVAQAQERLFYAVSVPNPAAKRFHVTIHVKHTKEKQLRFMIPAWCPGFYIIQNYERHISNVAAMGSHDQPLRVEQDGRRSWVVLDPDASETRFEYDVKCNDGGYGFIQCYMDGTGAFINGPACFMYLDGYKEKPVTLTAEQIPQGWKIATGMQLTDQPNVFNAANYDELIDCPIEFDNFLQHQFTMSGAQFEVVIAGKPRVGVDRWMSQLQKITEAALQIMGKPPFKRYVYIIHASPYGGAGGLEHLYSTVLSVSAGSDSIATLAAHEFFHTWNVKRIRPAVLDPFDYTKEVRTNNLWFAEGVTEYYAKLIVAAGRVGQSEHAAE